MDLRGVTHQYLTIRQKLGEKDLWLSPEAKLALDRMPVPQARTRQAAPAAASPAEGVIPRPSANLKEPVIAAPARVAPLRSGTGLSREQKEKELADLQAVASVCQKCPHLARSRTQVVFGVGNPNAEIMFVGEAPGADEDLAGEPFVGLAGKLLTKMIEAMALKRSDVYIGNVLKCRPDMPAGSSGNRKPTPGEMATCLPYLASQIEIIQPRVLVCLGATAVEGLLGLGKVTMGKIRGDWQDFRGIPAMATYHPAYLLRNQSISEKRKVWEDLLKVMEKVELPISEKQRGYFLRG
jgi:DNA polymerase